MPQEQELHRLQQEAVRRVREMQSRAQMAANGAAGNGGQNQPQNQPPAQGRQEGRPRQEEPAQERRPQQDGGSPASGQPAGKTWRFTAGSVPRSIRCWNQSGSRIRRA